VLATGPSLDQVIGDISVDPPVLTPNGDGRNEQVRISYALFGIEEAEVEAEIFTLSGNRVRRIAAVQRLGPRELVWEGLNEAGQLVPPGQYTCQITVTTQRGATRAVKSIAVVY
jgi:flagellar hook assembly protein FlgD